MATLFLLASIINWIASFVNLFDGNQTASLLYQVIAILFYLAALIKERT